MNYKIYERFIDALTCEELVKDYSQFTLQEKNRWQGGRKLIPKTSPMFAKLREESAAWESLSNRFDDPQFSEGLLSELGISSQEYQIGNVYSGLARRFSFLSRRASVPVRNSHPLFLLAWLFYGSCARALVLMLSAMALLKGRRLVELFYDASSAIDGYAREVHRDSDSRVFVFLLYLNSPQKNGNARGGELCLHELLENETLPDPQPPADAVRLLAKIDPEPGCLVIFENNETSYHSVPEMVGFDDERFFIYGGLTVLSGRAPPFKGRQYKLSTDFKMYL